MSHFIEERLSEPKITVHYLIIYFLWLKILLFSYRYVINNKTVTILFK
jgi:hypothetical protein